MIGGIEGQGKQTCQPYGLYPNSSEQVTSQNSGIKMGDHRTVTNIKHYPIP